MKQIRSIATAGVAMVALVAGGIGGSGAASSRPDLPDEVVALRDGVAVAAALPGDGRAALLSSLDALGALLGVPAAVDSSSSVARLPEAVAGRLALLADGLVACQVAGAGARAAFERAPDSAAEPAAAMALRRCAAPLQAAALETSDFLRAHPQAEGGSVDIWPLLRYSPGESDDTYVHDYVLLVDQGGNDRYLNNAGGNLLDHRRGPEGSAATEKAPARGCHTLGLDFVAGKGPTDGQCQIGQALLIDSAGNDVYGERQAPDPADDAFCTADPLVRRINTGGAGFAGVGILIDGAGDDSYVSKTISLGSGHVAGVGILRDEAGDDSYLSLRNAQGYALAGGLGLLRDDAGLCDNLPRQVQGTALLPGSFGIFVNVGGADRYRGAPPATQPDPQTPIPHSSQGYGGSGGVGYFLDEGGRDSYEGVPNRYDDLVVNPSAESSGVFEDKGSIEGGASGTPK